jgi:membrane AbrB-like protein
MVERIVTMLAIGAVGALLARRVKIPGGSLLGAMLATGAASLVLAEPQPLPEGLRWVALLLLGTYTGSSLDREVLGRIRGVLPVAMGTIAVLIAAAAGLGWMLYHNSPSDISLVTLMLGVMPGGASGLSAAAFDLHAEASLVASMHMVRQIMVFGALPVLLRWLAESGLGKRRRDTTVE